MCNFPQMSSVGHLHQNSLEVVLGAFITSSPSGWGTTLWGSRSPGVVSRCGPASPGILLEMQICGPHSSSLGLGPSPLGDSDAAAVQESSTEWEEQELLRQQDLGGILAEPLTNSDL